MFGPGGSFFVWVGGMNGGRDERTDCQRGGCMVVPGAVVSPGHHVAAPLAACPFCFFGGVRCGGLTGGWWAINAALDGCRG